MNILLNKWSRLPGGSGHRFTTSDLKKISPGFSLQHIISMLTQIPCPAAIFMLVYIEGKAFTWRAYLYAQTFHIVSRHEVFLPRLRSGCYVATRMPTSAFNSSGLHGKLRGSIWMNCPKGCGDEEVTACSKVLFTNSPYKLYEHNPEDVKWTRVTCFQGGSTQQQPVRLWKFT